MIPKIIEKNIIIVFKNHLENDHRIVPVRERFRNFTKIGDSRNLQLMTKSVILPLLRKLTLQYDKLIPVLILGFGHRSCIDFRLVYISASYAPIASFDRLRTGSRIEYESFLANGLLLMNFGRNLLVRY